ncbi:MAG: hypothetical protein LC647_16730 [Beggiatoa sp.]|nr:hypothetical protein [Beggiatoa sp.]
MLGPTAPPLLAQGTGKRVIEPRGAEALGIGTSPSKTATAKVGQDLLALYAEYQAHLKDTSGQGAPALAFKSSDAIAPVIGRSGDPFREKGDRFIFSPQSEILALRSAFRRNKPCPGRQGSLYPE